MSKKKILIVEDEIEVSERLAGLLKKSLKADVDKADDGEEALLDIMENDYALVILDIKMPGKSGLDILREIKESGKIPPPVIVVTGHDNDQVLSEAIELGAKAYLVKPIIAEDLIKKVKELLGREK